MAPYTSLDSTTMPGTTYKTAIDGNSVAALRIVGKFLPHAQSSPNMTVEVDAGHIFDGETLTEVAAQTTGTITAPIAHSRIDRIVVDNTSGAITLVSGTEATSPVAPAIPPGKSPVARIALTTSTVAISNSIITDERDFSAANAGGFGTQSTISSSVTCDIGTVQSHNVLISGTATITSFGSSASLIQPIYFLEFSGALTLTYDSTSMILPGARSIATAAGDTAIAEYLGAGNWRFRSYSGNAGSGLPVGSLYFNAVDSTNPATLLGYGTWASFGQGQVILGAGTGTDTNATSETFAAGSTGGEYLHNLTTDELPSLQFEVQSNNATLGQGSGVGGITRLEDFNGTANSYKTNSIGGGEPHNNMPPYITVYIWQRTE